MLVLVEHQNQWAGQQGRVGTGPSSARPPDQYRGDAVRERGGSRCAWSDWIHFAPLGRAEGWLVRRQLPVGARRVRKFRDAWPRWHGAALDRQFNATTLRDAGRTDGRRRRRRCHDSRSPVAARLWSGSKSAQQSGIVSVPSFVPIVIVLYASLYLRVQIHIDYDEFWNYHE